MLQGISEIDELKYPLNFPISSSNYNPSSLSNYYCSEPFNHTTAFDENLTLRSSEPSLDELYSCDSKVDSFNENFPINRTEASCIQSKSSCRQILDISPVDEKNACSEFSNSLIINDRVIDIEYDSDVGWVTKKDFCKPLNKEHKVINCESNKFVMPRVHKSSKTILSYDSSSIYSNCDEKEKIEGKVNSFKNISNEEKLKELCEEKEICLETSISKQAVSDLKNRRHTFQKCQSRSSETTMDSRSDIHSDDNASDDEIFSRGKNVSINGGSFKGKAFHSARSSSFDDVPTKKIIHRNSKNAKSQKANDSASIPNIIAKLQTNQKSESKMQSTKSSDYDRDRGRTRNTESGHRESFKKHERTNDRNSEQDRDTSDRELKVGSLNRSLSNTDANIEDRIGEISKNSFS